MRIHIDGEFGQWTSCGFCAGYVSEIAMWMAGATVLTAGLLTASTASSPPLASLRCCATPEAPETSANHHCSLPNPRARSSSSSPDLFITVVPVFPKFPVLRIYKGGGLLLLGRLEQLARSLCSGECGPGNKSRIGRGYPGARAKTTRCRPA